MAVLPLPGAPVSRLPTFQFTGVGNVRHRAPAPEPLFNAMSSVYEVALAEGYVRLGARRPVAFDCIFGESVSLFSGRAGTP